MRAFQVGKASQAGLSRADVALVSDLVDHQNSLWLNYSRGAPIRRLATEHEADLRSFYRAFAAFDDAVIDAYPSAKTPASGSIVIMNHCGGTDVPASCPPVYFSTFSIYGRQGMVDYLIGQGFHQVPDYASLSEPNDFAIWTSAPAAFPNCNVWGSQRKTANNSRRGRWILGLRGAESGAQSRDLVRL